MLGVIACALGLALGDELSIHLFHTNPAFLSLAFALGSAREVSWQSVALAVGGGMAAAIVAVMSPLRDILSRDPLAAIAGPAGKAPPSDLPRAAPRGRLGLRAHRWRAPSNPPPLPLPLAGLACLAGATAILLAKPDAALPGMVLLFAALLLELPLALGATLAVVKRLAGRVTSPVVHVATMELRAARARAMAIAATGAVAVFGSVAIQGAHGDLLAGLEGATRDMNAFDDVWVLRPAPTTSCRPAVRPDAAQAPAAGAGRARGGSLPQRAARLRRAPRAGDRPAAHGRAAGARRPDRAGRSATGTARVRAGGWVVLSRALAEEHHLRVGEAFTLPSPDPTDVPRRRVLDQPRLGAGCDRDERLRLRSRVGQRGRNRLRHHARLRRHARPGRPRDRTALGPTGGVPIDPGWRWRPRAARRRTERTQPPSARPPHSNRGADPARRGTGDGGSDGALAWQRRPRLAKLKLEGLARAELWRTILLESLLLVGVGCLTGAIFGLYGQQLADRALATRSIPGGALGHRAGGPAEPRAGERHRARDPRAPRLHRRRRTGGDGATGLMRDTSHRARGRRHDTRRADNKLDGRDRQRPYKQVARAEARQRTREALLGAAIEELTQGHWEKASLQERAAPGAGPK